MAQQNDESSIEVVPAVPVSGKFDGNKKVQQVIQNSEGGSGEGGGDGEGPGQGPGNEPAPKA